VIPAYIVSNSRRKGNNPCDCWKFKSKGVMKIRMLLRDNNIEFIEEYTFKDCLSPKGNLLKFDFYLPKQQILIEYDGEQHFTPQSFGDTKHTGEEKLALTQQYDEIKNNWCKENNIKLIRIPYTQYRTLTLQDLIPQKGESND
jgi:hypothetical protein